MAGRRYVASISQAVILKCACVEFIEGITAFSKRIRRFSVDGENDIKTISVDAFFFWETEQNSSVFKRVLNNMLVGS